ncbi:MAG: SDR family NAD(P)-dependent oxidoreductase, partial [Flavobacteriales bacterium]|nr:SDR family NAD(P)-dependent oxidoreductase [Flavobacteriales bacterium]
MIFDLKGKVAVVCGGTGGIGLAAAQALASAGASVVVVARNEEKLAAVVAALPGQGAHLWLQADFAHPAQVQEVVTDFATTSRAHILVNNTGGPPPGKASEADVESFRIAFNNHLICNHIMATALIPGMKAEGYGRIINVISTSVKQPLPNLGVSNTIRAAVANWAKTLANELAADGITVNNVLPGATETGR